MPPASPDDTRSELIECLRRNLNGFTKSDDQSVLKLLVPDDRGADEETWSEATRPYNDRLASKISPLAVIYRQCNAISYLATMLIFSYLVFE